MFDSCCSFAQKIFVDNIIISVLQFVSRVLVFMENI